MHKLSRSLLLLSLLPAGAAYSAPGPLQGNELLARDDRPPPPPPGGRDDGPGPGRGPGRGGKHGPREEREPGDENLQAMTVTGKIQSLAVDPRGRVDGIVFVDGTSARAGRRGRLETLGLKAVDTVTVTGRGGAYPQGRSLHIETIKLRAGPRFESRTRVGPRMSDPSPLRGHDPRSIRRGDFEPSARNDPDFTLRGPSGRVDVVARISYLGQNMKVMIAGRHKDGRIVLMAHEEGLRPLVQSADGYWSIEAPDPDELSEFSAITDSRARRRLVEAAQAFMKSEAAKDKPSHETRPMVLPESVDGSLRCLI